MYSIVTIDGQPAAETLLNETIGPDTELVHVHTESVRREAKGGQDNIMLAGSVTRFTFIFRCNK